MRHGYVVFDAPLVGFFPGMRSPSSDPRKARITIRDFVSMFSGRRGGYAPGEVESCAILETPNWLLPVLDLPMATEPGCEGAHYSGNTHLLSAIINQRAHSTAFEFAQPKLLAAPGFHKVVWPTDRRA